MSSKHKKAISLTERLKLVDRFDNLKKRRDKQLLKRAGVVDDKGIINKPKNLTI